jgi:hypothetical protein
MSRTPQERDDILHAIRQTVGFWGKTLTPTDEKFWLTALGHETPYESIKRALIEHTRVSRVSPKPADILGLIAKNRPQGGERRGPAFSPATRCPPEIAQAWLWFIGVVAETGTGTLVSGAFPKRDIDPDLQDRYLRIVNEEAARLGQPEAVPDQFKMPEVWAKAAPSRQEEFA